MNAKLPTVFISHGGGPWPWIPEMREQFSVTENELKKLGQALKPKVILSISGHWESPVFSVATSPHPQMIYDYSGFPPHTYQIQYQASGAPEIAQEVKSLLEKKGIEVWSDANQGFDHGTFVPLFLMYPEANIPIAQLSLKSSLNPAEHIEIGKLLEPLRSEGVLILGSGLSYHNLKSFFRGGGPVSEAFETWLTNAVISPPKEREEFLKHWEEAPSAKLAHPRADHLLPLMVIAGAAGNDSGKRIFLDKAFGVAMASYQFG